MTTNKAVLVAPEGGRSSSHRTLVLAMLLLVYTFNFIDRQILGILAQSIKTDLHLSDTQLGALGGIAFALLYSTLGVPLAVAADHTSRSWVITVSLTLWSAFTALCGMASNFWQLFAFRLGVGIGEAGGAAPSFALISDYYPSESRSRALAVYSLGIPVGLASGALLGGYIASSVNWRFAFIVVGLAGVVLAPVFRLVVKDPERATIKDEITVDRVPVSAAFKILARKPSFWLMSLAAAMSSLCSYGMAFWLPTILIRSFGFDLITTSQYISSLLLVGGCSGVFLGGWLADRAGNADRGYYAKLPAIAWILTVPLFAIGLWLDSPTISWLFLVLPHGLNLLWLGPLITAVQNLVPPHMRATATASFLCINNLIGLGAGSWVMGAMSDAMSRAFGTEALRYSTMMSLGFYLVAAGLILLAVRPLRRDWVAGAA